MTGPQTGRPLLVRVMVWAATGLAIAIVSAAAVWARVAQYPMWLPRPLPAVLEWFVEPGVLVWWFTIGGLFAGYPSTFAGYAAVVVGNTAVWLIVVVFVAFIVRRLRKVR